jgi:hypothetical protein
MVVPLVIPQANSGQRRTTMGHSSFDPVEQGPAWNAGKKLGAKRPLKPKEIWEIRFMLDREHRLRDRAQLLSTKLSLVKTVTSSSPQETRGLIGGGLPHSELHSQSRRYASAGYFNGDPEVYDGGRCDETLRSA